MMILLLIIGMGCVTFLLRLSFISVAGKTNMPQWLQRCLQFVPIAVLMAIIVPDLIYQQHSYQLLNNNERLIAGLVAALVAWKTNNVLLTIGTGMGLLWLLQSL